MTRLDKLRKLNYFIKHIHAAAQEHSWNSCFSTAVSRNICPPVTGEVHRELLRSLGGSVTPSWTQLDPPGPRRAPQSPAEPRSFPRTDPLTVS